MISKSEKATRKLGEKIAKKLVGGEILGLVGNLGSGKTILVQGLAKGLGIKKTINSPTFILMRNYRVNPPSASRRSGKKIKLLCHIDCYRLNSPQALVEIGIKDYLGQPDTICVIEWADKIKKILPPKAQWIKLKPGKKESWREIIL